VQLQLVSVFLHNNKVFEVTACIWSFNHSWILRVQNNSIDNQNIVRFEAFSLSLSHALGLRKGILWQNVVSDLFPAWDQPVHHALGMLSHNNRILPLLQLY